jgi:hypothetical protein
VIETPSDFSWFSHRIRLERAKVHLDALGRDIRGWCDRHRAVCATDYDPLTGIHTETCRLPVSIPDDDFGTLIGDVLHNCRSALNHLAYDLAVAHTGSLSKELEEGSEFPIFLTEPRNDAWEKRVGGIAPEAQAAIKSLQPYHPHDSDVDGLEALYRLSNIDKHRRPTLTGFILGDLEINPLDPSDTFDFFEQQPGPVIVEYGASRELARYSVASRKKANVGLGFTYGIAFDEPSAVPEGAPVLEILYVIAATIDNVFGTLEPFLNP